MNLYKVTQHRLSDSNKNGEKQTQFVVAADWNAAERLFFGEITSWHITKIELIQDDILQEPPPTIALDISTGDISKFPNMRFWSEDGLREVVAFALKQCLSLKNNKLAMEKADRYVQLFKEQSNEV